MNNIKGHIVTKIFSCVLLLIFFVVFCDIKEYAYADDVSFVGYTGDLSDSYYPLDDPTYTDNVNIYLDKIIPNVDVHAGGVALDSAFYKSHDIELRDTTIADNVGFGLDIENIAGEAGSWLDHILWGLEDFANWAWDGIKVVGSFVIDNIIVPIVDLVVAVSVWAWDGVFHLGFLFTVALAEFRMNVVEGILTLIGHVANSLGVGAAWSAIAAPFWQFYVELVMLGKDSMLDFGSFIKGGTENTLTWGGENIKAIAMFIVGILAMIAMVLVTIAAIILVVAGTLTSVFGIGVAVLAAGLALLAAAGALFGFAMMNFKGTIAEGTWVEDWQADARVLAPKMLHIALIVIGIGLIIIAIAAIVMVAASAIFGTTAGLAGFFGLGGLTTVAAAIGAMSFSVIQIISLVVAAVALVFVGGAAVVYGAGELGWLHGVVIFGINLGHTYKHIALNLLLGGIILFSAALMIVAAPLVWSSFVGLFGAIKIAGVTAIAGIKGLTIGGIISSLGSLSFSWASLGVVLSAVKAWSGFVILKGLVISFVGFVGSIAAAAGGGMIFTGAITVFAYENPSHLLSTLWWGTELKDLYGSGIETGTGGLLGVLTWVMEGIIGVMDDHGHLDGGICGLLFGIQEWLWSGFGFGEIWGVGILAKAIGYLVSIPFILTEVLIGVVGVGLQIFMVGNHMALVGIGAAPTGSDVYGRPIFGDWGDVPTTMIQGLLQFTIETVTIMLNPFSDGFRPGLGLANLAIIVCGGAKGAGVIGKITGTFFKVNYFTAFTATLGGIYGIAGRIGRYGVKIGNIAVRGVTIVFSGIKSVFISIINFNKKLFSAKDIKANIPGIIKSPTVIKLALVSSVLILVYPILDELFGGVFADTVLMGMPLMMLVHKGGEVFKVKVDSWKIQLVDLKLKDIKDVRILENFLNILDLKNADKNVIVVDVLGNERIILNTPELRIYVAKMLSDTLKLSDFYLFAKFKFGEIGIFRELDLSGLTLRKLDLAKAFEIKLADLNMWQIKKLSIGDVIKIDGVEISGKFLLDMKVNFRNVALLNLVKDMTFSRESFINTFNFLEGIEINGKIVKIDGVSFANLKLNITMKEIVALKLSQLGLKDLKTLFIDGKEINGISVDFLTKELGVKISLREVIATKLAQFDIRELEMLFEQKETVNGISLEMLKEYLKVDITFKEVMDVRFAKLTEFEFKSFLVDGKEVRGITLEILAKKIGVDVQVLKTDFFVKYIKENIIRGEVDISVKLMSFINGEFTIKFGGKEITINGLIQEFKIDLGNLKFELFKE
ncbi:hypothetical protein KAU39_02520, partial [bacterium]|nr:hypothetical protein [bacterium]